MLSGSAGGGNPSDNGMASLVPSISNGAACDERLSIVDDNVSEGKVEMNEFSCL